MNKNDKTKEEHWKIMKRNYNSSPISKINNIFRGNKPEGTGERRKTAIA